MTQPRQDQERDEAVAPAYVWVHGDDTSRTTWSACLNDRLNGVGATNVDLFDDGRVAGIETMAGPATPRELLAVIRHMRWHTAVQPEAEYRAILDVVSAARAWRELRRGFGFHEQAITALIAAVDALPPQAPPDAPQSAGLAPVDVALRAAGFDGPYSIREGDEPGVVVHEYVSTACQHDHHDYCARCSGSREMSMSGFAVIRHTEYGWLGTARAEAMDLHHANGWVRVSDYRHDPAVFNLPDFADAPDLDAPEEVEDVEELEASEVDDELDEEPAPATPVDQETEE